VRIKKNRPLIYTVVTNDDEAFSCAFLLFKSLNKFLRDNFDFKIIVPESSSYACSPELQSYLFPIYNYHYRNQHIFTLKYHYKIFNQPYNYFIYMDSDILWMIDSLFNLNYNCLCFENISILNKAFSKFWPGRNKRALRGIPGINAGFFGLQKKIALDLSDFMVRNLYNRRRYHIFLEQNMFNYYVYNNLITNKNTWVNINNHFILGAEIQTPFYSQKAYHFNGNLGQMQNKQYRMKGFLDANNIVL